MNKLAKLRGAAVLYMPFRQADELGRGIEQALTDGVEPVEATIREAIQIRRKLGLQLSDGAAEGLYFMLKCEWESK